MPRLAARTLLSFAEAAGQSSERRGQPLPQVSRTGIGARVEQQPGGRDGVALRVAPSDGESWATGDGGPEVAGRTADLLWWLLGRGDGAGVTSSEGQLPDLGKWA